MSLSKYFKNHILCGDADYHCLLCKETFKAIADVEKHIRWEKHRKTIKNQTSLPKFKKDGIFKVENNYYCEFCNYTTRDIAAVGDHINEDKHKLNKNRPEGVVRKAIVHYDSGLLVLDNMIINNDQWHCVINTKCLLCNTIIQDFAKHVVSQEHVIKLIQAHVQSMDGQYYRKINKDVFQCFTCGRYFSTELFTDHWSSKNHMDNICVPEQMQSSAANSKSKVKRTTEDARPKSRDIISSEILEMLAEEARKMIIETQKQFFDFNTDHKTATCKVCKKVVLFDLKDILEHMKTHADVKVTEDFDLERRNKNEESDDEVVFSEVQDHGKRRSELAKFGKENFIKLYPGGSKGFCMLCDKYFSASLRVFKQHMKGVCHLGHLEIKGLIQSREHYQFDQVLFPLNAYIISLTHAREMKVLWINREFTVDCYSVMLLKKIEFDLHYKIFKCYACDEVVREGNEFSHCKTTEHKTKFMDVKIFAYDTEFIREVQPNLFHCGFCNQIFPFADILEKHLQKPKHGLRKKKMEENAKSIVCNYEKLPSANNSDILYLQLMKATFGKC